MNAPIRQSRRVVFPFVSSVLWFAAAGAGSASGAYQFHTIVNNQGPFTVFSFRSAQGINDAGEVAFYATDNTFPNSGIYKSSGGAVTNISTDPDHTVDSQFTGSINEGGSVVFRGDDNAFQGGIWSGSGGGLTSVIYEGDFDPDPRWILSGAATINDAGAVAFYGGRTNFPDQQPGAITNGYHVVTGGSLTTMVEEGAVYELAGAHPPAFNDAGQAAFTMRAVADNSFHILRYDNPGLVTIETGFTGTHHPSMNADGDVAFVNQTSTAVKVYRDGVVETIASTADGFNSFQGGNAFINDASDMAFEAAIIGSNGVFTGTDLFNDRVLLVGNPLFGRIVTSVDLLGLNNAGQILMSVGLSGSTIPPAGWYGLIVATPPLKGDFDENGFVDGEDLADWQDGYGLTGTAIHADGDADSDQDVDGADFLAWQRQLGSDVAIAAVSAAVPEPATLMLSVLTAAGVSTRRRWYARRVSNTH